jgi:carbon storage regulator
MAGRWFVHFLAVGQPPASPNGFGQMLVVTRRRGDRLLIGKDIEILVTRIVDGQVRLAIQAPPDVQILRKELLDRPKEVAK